LKQSCPRWRRKNLDIIRNTIFVQESSCFCRKYSK